MRWIKSIIERFQSNRIDLVGGGERVDIQWASEASFDRFDMYQKSHFRRYEFAQSMLSGERCGDFACGTGYGTVMLADKFGATIGADINAEVVAEVTRRYQDVPNAEFIRCDLLELDFRSALDAIVSFETVEHLPENSIPRLFEIFRKALKPGGRLIFSVPFLQEIPVGEQDLGFHLTFLIDEKKVEGWLANAGLELDGFKYQNYATHVIQDNLEDKDFLICMAHRN
jgi:SAM-dependent methyltransferase